MTLTIRPMQDSDAAAVVAMVKGLARDTGSDVIPKLTPENLIAHRDLIDVTIAEDGSGMIGACLTLLTYSTWRDAKGLYALADKGRVANLTGRDQPYEPPNNPALVLRTPELSADAAADRGHRRVRRHRPAVPGS